MKKTLLFLSFLVVMGIFTACDKDDDPVEPSPTELLVAHEWQGIEAVAYEDGTAVDTLDLSIFTFLFAVNHDLFVYREGILDEQDEWEYISGSPDIIRLTPIAPPKVEQPLFYIPTNYKVSETLDLKVETLTTDKLTFYIEEIVDGVNEKYIYYFKK